MILNENQTSQETGVNFLVDFSTREGERKKGPLDLMWSLIQKYEVDIFQVSLTRITDDFFEYMEKHPVALAQKSAFSQIASRLIFYKSKRLLPDTEKDEPDHGMFDTLPDELIDKLLEYKKLQVAAEYLNGVQKMSQMGAHREPSWQRYEKDIDFFRVDMVSFLKTFKMYLLRGEAAQNTTFYIEPEEIDTEKLGEWLHKKLIAIKKVFFSELVRETSLLRMIGLFLAILEMCKQSIVRASQVENYDIMIELK